MAVKMIRAYVVVDSCGMWVTRQFGSAKAAIKNLNKAREEAGDMNCTAWILGYRLFYVILT